MRIISHRGNLCGPEENDNVPSKIQEAAERFLVEIDVWHIKNQWFLGHDKPEHLVSFEFISHPNFIIHTKNLDALSSLINTDLHYFWHQADDFTLTSKNLIWTYPNKKVTPNSIIVCQTQEEVKKYKSTKVWGICTDYVLGELI